MSVFILRMKVYSIVKPMQQPFITCTATHLFNKIKKLSKLSFVYLYTG
jgi:hypothetical protein